MYQTVKSKTTELPERNSAVNNYHPSLPKQTRAVACPPNQPKPIEQTDLHPESRRNRSHSTLTE